MNDTPEVAVDQSWMDNLEDAPGRGRPKKVIVPGTVKHPVEFTPKALTAIERVKEIARLVPGGGVPTRSQIVCNALASYVEQFIRQTRDNTEYLRDLLPLKDLAAARSLPFPATVPVPTNDDETSAAITILYDWYSRERDETFKTAGDLIARVLCDVATGIMSEASREGS